MPLRKKVSIIIPCYNVEVYIQRCIDSLLKQTMQCTEMELIFVNDASSDQTLSILLENECKHEELIMVVNCEQNSGVSAARNLGMQYASGEYIGFVDSDDYVAPNMYECLYDKAVQYQADFVICGYKKVNVRGPVEDAEAVEGAFIDLKIDAERKRILSEGQWNTAPWNKLYSRKFLNDNEINFPVGIRFEDTYFTYLVYGCGASAYEIKNKLYYYYDNSEGIIRSGSAVKQLERMESGELLMLELKKRGLKKRFYEEWEIVFIRKYYMDAISIMFFMFEEVPYNAYLYLCDFMRKEFPACSNNPYLEQQANLNERLFIGLMDMTKVQLKQAQCMISGIYVEGR